MILYLARRYDRAAMVLQRVQEISPDHFLLHMRMGLVRIQQGKFQDATQELETAVHLANESTETLAALAVAYAAAGKLDEARALSSKLEADRDKRYVLPYNFAKIYSACGDVSKTFEWLECAYQDGSPDLIELNSEPIFDPVRDDPRFSQLMRRVGWRDANV